MKRDTFPTEEGEKELGAEDGNPEVPPNQNMRTPNTEITKVAQKVPPHTGGLVVMLGQVNYRMGGKK